MQFPSSELVLNPSNEVYHLGLSPKDIAHKIILVGDQDRVSLVSDFFDSISHKTQHREFCCHTGKYKGKDVSVISTGIGTDNIDIVINELDALVNIDLINRTEKAEHTSLELVRIGTCGIIQDDIEIDGFILSEHALGLDNVGHFYELKENSTTLALEKEILNQIKVPKNVIPYLASADRSLVEKLNSDQVTKGITVTSGGFYGPQGRRLRIPLAEAEMNASLNQFNHNGNRLTNFEMESSSLFALSNALGHKATTICMGVANRRKKEFSKNYSTRILELIEYVLDRV